MLRSLALGVLLCTSALPATGDLATEAAAVMKKRCFACHGAALKMSGLDLTTRDGFLNGGERGAAVVPFYPAQSKLHQYVTHQQNPTMPPGEKLPDAEIQTLERWILAGAPWNETGAAPAADVQEALRKLEERAITPEERSFWSFRPVAKAKPPAIAGSRIRNAVDAFLWRKFEENGLKPSPPADKRTLVRRLYLDLTGLPPSPDEVRAFLNDSSADAYEKLVEKLLASPHYGERWARYWLDLVRYADSGGFERDYDRPEAWRYRDYVIKAFNEDRPYDQFIREQIAGDELRPGDPQAMVATGFLRLGPENNIKDERTRMDDLDDIVSTTSQSFLGMTVGCARCHNHKFDPIPQKDYYQIQAVFFSTKEHEFPLVPQAEVERYKSEMKRIDTLQEPLKERIKEIEKPYYEKLRQQKIDALPEYIRIALETPAEKRTEGQRLNARQVEKTLRIESAEMLAEMSDADKARHTELTRQVKDLDKQRPKKYPTAMAIAEHGREPLPSFFLHRGDPGSKGSRMSPGVLSVAAKGEVNWELPPEEVTSSGRRLSFANWLASEENPLTARVMVNRIWQHHFGEGIVRTPSNFGTTGWQPKHPELLDWLAAEFVRSGWSIKHIHRLLVTSEAYRMASDDIAANTKKDPENVYFWRMPRRRLDAEAIRDLFLAVSGKLDPTLGGPAVFPYIDPVLFQSSTDRTWHGKPEGDPSTFRRSIYVFLKRSIRYPLFEAFDQPDTVRSCDRRNRSTTGPQALLLMNNAFVRLMAKYFAERVVEEAGTDPQAQISRAYEIALSRPPSDFERTESAEFLREGGKEALPDFCQTLMNLNEFVYLQ